MTTMFEAAIEVVLAWEGGAAYTEDPADPGGATKWGISLAYLRRLDASATAADVKALTREQAEQIYWRDFWVPIKGDGLPPPLALFTFDSAVNLGVPRAARLLQQAVGSAPDGVIGPRTLGAAASVGGRPEALARALVEMATDRVQIYVTRPGFQRFGRGWTRRVFDVHGRAVSLAIKGGTGA